jgi:hypothetical protein
MTPGCVHVEVLRQQFKPRRCSSKARLTASVRVGLPVRPGISTPQSENMHRLYKSDWGLESWMHRLGLLRRVQVLCWRTPGDGAPLVLQYRGLCTHHWESSGPNASPRFVRRCLSSHLQSAKSVIMESEESLGASVHAH